jgi:hypothetical protein
MYEEPFYTINSPLHFLNRLWLRLLVFQCRHSAGHMSTLYQSERAMSHARQVRKFHHLHSAAVALWWTLRAASLLLPSVRGLYTRMLHTMIPYFDWSCVFIVFGKALGPATATSLQSNLARIARTRSMQLTVWFAKRPKRQNKKRATRRRVVDDDSTAPNELNTGFRYLFE